jgi:hypothetical protein
MDRKVLEGVGFMVKLATLRGDILMRTACDISNSQGNGD